MKLDKFLLPLGIIGLVVLGFFAYSSIAAPLPAGFPSPTADGEIEVKQYPAYRAATVQYSGELSQAANSSFNPLYRHISSNDISMTAPVETRYPASTLEANEMASGDEQGEAYVSFLYRNTEVYPEQVSQNIQVEDIEAMTVVSLGLKGSYSYSSYQQNIKRLQNWLDRHPEYQVVGSPRRFFYDAPFVPEALKRSEIQVPIRIQR